MRGCLVKNCLSLAKWVPSVVVTFPDNDNKFRLDFDIPVCDKDKDNLKIADVVPDSSLATIQSMFRQSNLSVPTRDNMKLEWTIDVPKSLDVVDSRGRSLGKANVT